MTEAEWLKVDLESKLHFLWGTASDRKLRLFACACCRSVWYLIEAEPARRAIEVAEKFANGRASKRELADAHRQLTSYIDLDADNAAFDSETGAVRGELLAALHASLAHISVASICETASQAINAIVSEDCWNEWEENATVEHVVYQEETRQARLLDDIIGDPFRPASVSPSWLTATVVSLAQAIHDAGQFQHLPILADALEDAGCDHPRIFQHCRQPGEHVRGCWAVDLVLGK